MLCTQRARGADVAPEAAAPGPFPGPERIPRVARVLALAHHWQGLIRSGAVRNQADLARLVGVSRARVTQVLDLLWLAPEIQEDILSASGDAHWHCRRRHKALCALATLAHWSDQVGAWR